MVHQLARVDWEGAAGEAVSSAGGADRLDRGRGRHSLSDRLGAAADGVRALAREGRKLAAKIGDKRTAVRDRSRAAGRGARDHAHDRHRSGQAKEEVLELTEQTGRLLASRSRRRGGWPPRPGAGPGGAAPRPSSRPRVSSRSSPTAARKSPSRSPSGSRARRSSTGSSRCGIPTPGRSARASSHSPTNSAT